MGVPEKIKNGTKFKICDHDELVKKGWFRPPGSKLSSTSQRSYEHADYHGVITFAMIDGNAGKLLTVKDHAHQNWYFVEENDYQWPVDTFLETSGHICEEGMTPIFGWFICKTCGTNLKEVK